MSLNSFSDECPDWAVYTDGSANPNPGPGGAGAIILYKNEQYIELSHCGGLTTNNQMELYALIMTFPWLPKDTSIWLYTDSEYVQKGLNCWCKNWIRNGWKTANNKDVKNKELWQRLITLQKEYPLVSIRWIKAHNGHKWNERADQLAGEGTLRN